MPLPALRRPARHPRYTYVTADLRTGALMEEIDLGGVTFSRGLNEAGVLSGSFAYTARSAALLRPATTPARTALYALRDGQAVWGGIVWTRRVDHGSRIVELGCADWWSYFDHRFITTTTDFIDVDQNDVARALVATAQAAAGGNLGIEAVAGTSGNLLDITFDWFNYTGIGEALRQLAEGENGCDIRFDTVGSIADGFTRQLAIGTPRLGRSATESGLVLDYGGQGATLEGLVESEDGSTVESLHHALGPGSEEGKLVGIATRADVLALGWPLLEGITTYSDETLDSDEAINARARADLDARAGIRTLPTASERGLAVGEIEPGDEVLLEVESDWYNDSPAEALTGVWAATTRVTSFSVAVPDDGGREVITPLFGDLVVTSRTITRGRPSSTAEGFSMDTPAEPGGGAFGDGPYGDGPYGP